MTNEPKNASETFADAIKKATEHFNETLGEMEEKFPFLEVASEVEREVDGIEKWIVIEFNEVE